ncbi:DUF1223 domain-containing protein [Rhodoferax sp.]|uniref:DUF1223 domain-containing protein n=1 Tax=Rhodoferax sp. TaxID=50421 RepID=UPI0027474550|nr:DUF1223 domain-containing protein [Rhodoferax sp.]
MHLVNARHTLLALLCLPVAALATNPVCEVRSTETLTPVIELYTSEGCSSCPPADQWLSTQKGKPVVAQAFHVGYWDYIGWVDRFASPQHTERQRQLAAANGLRGIYTPQLARNGRDWRDYAAPATAPNEPARATITLLRAANDPDSFEAKVSPAAGVATWSAYWTVTEHGHSSRVKAGENNGETLKHDFVVRQYTPVGRYQGAQSLKFAAIAAKPEHPRQVNLVVINPQGGQTLQAVSLSCG